jgi:hypothetical protein
MRCLSRIIVVFLVILSLVVLGVLGFSQYLVAVHSAGVSPLLDSPSSSVIGSPSLSAAFVNEVLSAYDSPASGTGQSLYALSQQYNIDDAYALAFFMHESAFGTTGVARLTRSLGNIRCSAAYVCIDGFRAYPSWIAGYQDWYNLIRSLYINQWHLSTVQQIVPVYAPSSDHNNVAGYIAAVLSAVTTWRAGQVTAYSIVSPLEQQ